MAVETFTPESGLRKRNDGLHQVHLWECVNGEGDLPPGGVDSAEMLGTMSAPLPSPGGRRPAKRRVFSVSVTPR